MEKSLAKLRVADLKSLLTTAGIKSSAKTKADLTKAVLASPAAVEAYNKQYPAKVDELDLLAPPEDVDWNEDSVSAPEESKAEVPATVEPVAETKVPETATATETSTTMAVKNTAADEEEKRRQRANRFGIPLVEPKKPRAAAPAPTVMPAKAVKTTTTKVVDDPEKRKARAARFGIEEKAAATPPAVTGKKRAAPPVENVDAEELERRRKRAERFGTAPAAAK